MAGAEGEDARAVTRASSPLGVRAPWRSSRSWSLSVLMIDSIRCRIQPIGGLGRSGALSVSFGRRSSACSSRTAVSKSAPAKPLSQMMVVPSDRVGFEQCECGFAFAGVGGDEVKVADRAVGSAEQHEFEAPVAARVGRAVAEAGPGRELALSGWSGSIGRRAAASYQAAAARRRPQRFRRRVPSKAAPASAPARGSARCSATATAVGKEVAEPPSPRRRKSGRSGTATASARPSAPAARCR